jgi:hypothetical protein
MEHNNIEQSESSSCQPSSLPLTSQEQSINSSGALSRRASIAEGDVKPPKGKKLRVQFDESVHSPSERPVSHVGGEASLLGSLAGAKQMPTALINPGDTRQGSRSRFPQGADDASTDITELHSRPSTEPSLGKFSLGPDDSDLEDNTEENNNNDEEEIQTMDEKEMSQRIAHSRAESLSRSLRGQGSQHAQSSRNPTAGSPPESPPDSPIYATNKPLDLNNIPLEKLAKKRKKFSVEDESDTEDEEDDEPGMTPAQRRIRRLKAAVASLIGAHHKSIDSGSLFRVEAANSGNTSGHVTPIDEHGDPVEYIERPSRYRTGVLSSLMRLYDDEGAGGGLGFRSAHTSPTPSGTGTPVHKPPLWYKDEGNRSSTASLTNMLHTSKDGSPAESQPRPPLRRQWSSQLKKVRGKRPKHDSVIHISNHIEEQLARYNYLIKLCKALMEYGAPTHRLEGTRWIFHVPMRIPPIKPQMNITSCTSTTSFVLGII